MTRLSSFLIPGLMLLVACCSPSLHALQNVDFRMSGAWFDPTHDGEGFLVEVLDDEWAVVYWFTYDEAGAQRWFIGTGDVQDNAVVVDELLAGSGARFGENFDAEDVNLSPVGNLSLSWLDCEQAVADYTIDGVTGNQSLARLTSLDGLDCLAADPAGSPHSGSWYDLTHEGEGLVIEVLPDGRVLLFWFSYDSAGNPAWFFGIGEISGSTVAVSDMLTTSGGRFGPAFDPADVEIRPWGSLLVELGCQYGKLDYAADTAEFSVGKQTLVRLTQPGNPRCEEPDPPNILLVIADDLGLDSSSQYSIVGDLPNTPVLDNLAERGLVFENTWSNPVCSATRAGILTGKYGFRTGVLGVGDQLAITETSLQSFIHRHLPGKYADAVIGKWHLGPEYGNPDHPADLGISHFSGLLGGGLGNYENWTLTTNGQQSSQTAYSTSKLVDLAINWVEGQNQPWFLWLAFNAPHTPFHLPPLDLHDRQLPGSAEDIDANPRSYYLAAIEAMDSELGRFLDSLDDRTRDNTIIIFVGDNGTPGLVAQAPFTRGTAKGSLYQGGINVPLIVSGPGVNRAGQRESALVNTTDLYSTIASMAGVNISEVHDSISFVGLLNGMREHERTFQYSEKRLDNIEEWSISDGKYKLIESVSGVIQLFDLESDPYETDDLVENGSATGDALESLGYLLGQIRQ
jgi:arylsulfatase A-like enzyme